MTTATKDINDLRQDRAATVAELRKISDAVKAEKRDWTDEEKASWESLSQKAAELKGQIERAQQLADLEGDVDDYIPRDDPSDGNIPDADDKQTKFSSLGEQLRAAAMAEEPGRRYVDPRLLRAATGLSEGIPSDGGFLVQTDFASELLRRVYDFGAVAGRCRRIPISPTSNGLKFLGVDETSRASGSRWGGVQVYWTHEANQFTASAPNFKEMSLELEKLTGLYYATDELLNDTTALEALVTQAFSEEFAFKVDDEIIGGTGAGEPLGILNAAATVSIAKETGQLAATVVFENIIKMYARLWTRSMTSAVWFINQDVLPQLHSLVLPGGTSSTPAYLPPGGLSESPYGRLMGLPVIAIEQCKTLGTVGDIILADLSQYLIIDKGPVDQAASIHLRFDYDETAFRFILRLNGQPLWDSALTPANGTNTVSPFITLATRA